MAIDRQASPTDQGAAEGAKKRPRPLLRGLIAALCGAIAAVATRYDALSKPGGRSVLWLPIVIAVVVTLAAGIAAALTLYLPAKKELNEAARADDEALNAQRQGLRASRILIKRDQALAGLRDLSERQNELIAAKPTRRPELTGLFKQKAVEGAASTVQLFQESDEVKVRAILIEYNGPLEVVSKKAHALTDQEEPLFVPGPMSGQPLFGLKFDANDDFSRAALKLINSDTPPFYLADASENDPDIVKLALPGRADHFLRIRIASGPRKYGLLCVDTWGTQALTENEVAPALAIAKLLSAGLGATSKRTYSSSSARASKRSGPSGLSREAPNG
jgi:hypothetical protein